jgi:hypothetical protein
MLYWLEEGVGEREKSPTPGEVDSDAEPIHGLPAPAAVERTGEARTGPVAAVLSPGETPKAQGGNALRARPVTTVFQAASPRVTPGAMNGLGLIGKPAMFGRAGVPRVSVGVANRRADVGCAGGIGLGP